MATVRKRTWNTKKGETTKWVADYSDQNRKRHWKQFKLKKEAEAWLAETRVEVRRGDHTPDSSSVTVAEACALWLDRCRDGTPDEDPLERSTVREYENHTKFYITNPEIGIGGTKLAQLTNPMVRQFEKRLGEAGKSQAMVRKVRSSLSGALSNAIELGLVNRHVIRDASQRGRRKRKPRERKEVVIPTKEELRALLENAKGNFRPLLVTAIFTGMRASELRGLMWEDVDLDEKVIRVRRRADRWNEIGPPKTASGNRDISLAPMVINTLKEWRLSCPRRGDEGELWLAFPTGRGNVQALATIWKRQYAPLQIASGVVRDTGEVDDDGKPILKAKYGFHALRHAAAALFIEQDFTPKKIQALMGHSSMQMTYDTYGHLFLTPDDDQSAMAQIEARLIG